MFHRNNGGAGGLLQLLLFAGEFFVEGVEQGVQFGIAGDGLTSGAEVGDDAFDHACFELLFFVDAAVEFLKWSGEWIVDEFGGGCLGDGEAAGEGEKRVRSGWERVGESGVMVAVGGWGVWTLPYGSVSGYVPQKVAQTISWEAGGFS